jgi:hypothetical protein
MIEHPRVVEYAKDILRLIERRIVQFEQVAAQPEAAAFAPDVHVLIVHLKGAVAHVAQALAFRRSTIGGSCG